MVLRFGSIPSTRLRWPDIKSGKAVSLEENERKMPCPDLKVLREDRGADRVEHFAQRE